MALLNFKKDAQALEDFVQNLYWGESISAKESKKRLEEGLIEARQCGQHSFNGLLVTDNGYFITARHCVDRDFSGTRIYLHNGYSYPIEKICCWGKKEDVALVKAEIGGEPAARRYRIYAGGEIKNVPFAMMARREGSAAMKCGFVMGTYNQNVKLESGGEVSLANHFVSDIPARRGDSGGIAVSAEGRLMGITCIGTSDAFFVSILKFSKVLGLISFYAGKLMAR
ncbi:MAG: serine protease [Nanoarchaeota archaeon]|nr:serine protease [Nanoarchaeota archaeon]